MPKRVSIKRIHKALDDMFDEACVADSDLGYYFESCEGIFYYPETGVLTLTYPDGHEDNFSIEIKKQAQEAEA